MEPSAGRSPSWVMADGAASISSSMLVAVLINVISPFSGLWGLGFLQELTNKQDGMIVVATLLLLPTSFAVYGVSQMIFAAKEAVERRAMEKGRKAGIQEGRQEGRKAGIQEGRQEGRQEGEQAERERIEQILEQHGVELPEEVAKMIARESGSGPRS